MVWFSGDHRAGAYMVAAPNRGGAQEPVAFTRLRL